MQPKHFLIPSLLFILASCQKSINPGPLPVAGFNTTADSSNGVLIMGTYRQYLLKDASANAVSWHWNFGNDSTSDQQTPVLQYPKSGTYTISLTVKNKAGVTSTITRGVKVLDRYMQQLIITGFAPYDGSVDHSVAHANLYAVIRLAEKGVSYPFPKTGGVSFNAPILFQTPVVVADSSKLPYVFNIPGSPMINYGAVLQAYATTGPVDIGYGLELYAQDAGGTFLVSSSFQHFYYSGADALKIPVDDLQQKAFVMQYANVKVTGDYQ